MKCDNSNNKMIKGESIWAKICLNLKKNKRIYVFIIILICVIITFLILKGNNRIKKLNDINLDNHLNFKILDDELTVGDSVKSFVDKGYLYASNEMFINSDSISMATFKKDNNDLFFALLYCPNKNKCSIDESKVVKINFYEKSKVIIDNYIKYGMTYEEVKSKLGKESGKFYLDNDYYVWTFGKNIGDPYYIIKFDTNTFLSTGGINDIRIGVWWYKGESNHSIIKEGANINEE